MKNSHSKLFRIVTSFSKNDHTNYGWPFTLKRQHKNHRDIVRILQVLLTLSHMALSYLLLFQDLAMIRLQGYVDFVRNPHVSPVCLPDLHENFAGYRCHVSGWGKDAFEAGSYQHVLKEGMYFHNLRIQKESLQVVMVPI